jgi:hypothetical protein
LAVTLTAVSVLSFSQDAQKLDPALDQIVGADAKLERVATGFDKWTEGPVWTRENTLLFAEIPANNIIQWVSGKGASVFMHPSGYKGSEPYKGPEPGSNGMTLDADGRVSVAGHAGRTVWRMESVDPKAQITLSVICLGQTELHFLRTRRLSRSRTQARRSGCGTVSMRTVQSATASCCSTLWGIKLGNVCS